MLRRFSIKALNVLWEIYSDISFVNSIVFLMLIFLASVRKCN